MRLQEIHSCLSPGEKLLFAATQWAGLLSCLYGFNSNMEEGRISDMDPAAPNHCTEHTWEGLGCITSPVLIYQSSN